MSNVDKTKRQQVYKQIRDAADALLQELGVEVLVRKALMLFYVQGKIKKLLAL
jgi:trimethylamine:corrinoid methyltransferase-like protein